MESPLRKLRKSSDMTLWDLKSAVEEDGQSITVGHLSILERGLVWPSRPVVDVLVLIFKGKLTEMDILYPFGTKKGSENES